MNGIFWSQKKFVWLMSCVWGAWVLVSQDITYLEVVGCCVQLSFVSVRCWGMSRWLLPCQSWFQGKHFLSLGYYCFFHCPSFAKLCLNGLFRQWVDRKAVEFFLCIILPNVQLWSTRVIVSFGCKTHIPSALLFRLYNRCVASPCRDTFGVVLRVRLSDDKF